MGAGQQDHGLEDPPIGNGRAMSVLFASEGAALVLADVDAASLEATEALVREQGAQCVGVLADAAEEAGIAGDVRARARAPSAAWTGS